ncbi:SGNH/GDSL hydrolase family protein [Hymenobacter convexus]|uniref:SGNH/GDSL hydrolase family protein n=1 Tax=Hymenobacter sp. CA1UV-4 TaxID=3063782 RepID=UPI002714005C|nr:SGNH/GDSL hydrolase family protein [Hymenobacter sp. CA1UV-4]MDO7850919.1 SGNH/GDSL hydrolase family protein [Hymenobacter sp. CA1UV-4]
MTFSAKHSLPALALLGLTLGSCQPQLDDNRPAADAGQLNFSSYVAVGNSLTAGYSDGGLYNEVQAVSYPAILAQQFAKTGKGPASFVQPAFSAAKKDGSGYIKLQLVNGVAAPIQPSAANNFLGEQVAYTSNNPLLPNELEAYTGAQPDNLGVPGISVLSADKTASSTGNAVVDATTRGAAAQYGSINNFYQRLLPAADRTTKDYVTYIGQKTPTFFSCWMGSNDVLTYAVAGAVASPTNPFSGLTDTTSFGKGYRNIINAISKNGTVKGVCATIPNVTAIPYFNTVTVTAVAAAFKAANAASPGVFITTGTAAAPVVRLATSADLLTLTAQGVVATGAGSLPNNPIPNQYVLDAAEITTVLNRTNQLNAIIAKTARQNKLALADMFTFFNSVAAQGIVTNAVNNTATFASGNIFSLDGVHPTPRGYAVVANEFIRNINAYYGSNVPTVAPNDYRGVLFP